MTISHEIEEYLLQQWCPFMLEKINLIVSKGTSISSSFTNEINQFFHENEEYIKVKELNFNLLTII